MLKKVRMILASSTAWFEPDVEWPFPSLETRAKESQMNLAASKTHQLKMKEAVAVGEE